MSWGDDVDSMLSTGSARRVRGGVVDRVRIDSVGVRQIDRQAG